MNLRIEKLLVKLEKNQLDAIIVSSCANISYLTGFLSRDSYLLVSKKQNFYFTDGRYVLEVKKPLKGIAALKKINGSAFKLIAAACKASGFKLVAFEERHLPYAEYKKIKEELAGKVKLMPCHGLIEELRQEKEPREIKKIKKAIQITGAAFKFIEKLIVPGRTELEIVAELERFIRYKGASGPAFDIIVAAGENSGFPHHIPGKRKIRKNEPVLIDMGVEFMGYKCDLTRVFFSDKIKVLAKRIYGIVREAQEKAIRKISPGAAIRDIDAASRNFIAAKGFGPLFSHSLGHGVGLEIHEHPHISGKSKGALSPGMVFTVEPAIYLPGKFGIRIEDMVLVTEKGCEVLSGSIYK